MNKAFTVSLFFLLIFGFLNIYSQTVIPLTDNMTVASNQSVILAPNTYQFADTAKDGVIVITNKENITIDAANVNVIGQDFQGYMLYIINSKNITIKNFKSVSKYFYGAFVQNSQQITFDNCNFSGNKIDSSGWISIWTDIDQALGGGVLMDSCQNSTVSNCIMRNQNDGVALYHCDSINVSNCNFSWNTSYGIRMYFTDNSYIYKNNCANVNRPLTDPSDCAAVLMLVSNKNTVLNNDFTNSGDGIFLGQYKYSQIPNLNYFAYNDCSGSPHNAIEATFANGNVFKHNTCNTSQYGFWLGYSYNTLVDSNEISYNQFSGISIEWGFNNTFSNNNFKEDPIGIQLFQTGTTPMQGYENNYSSNYFIKNNTFENNEQAVLTEWTEHTVIESNTFTNNWSDVKFLNLSNLSNDTVSNNIFYKPVTTFLYNNSPRTIYSANNSFTPDDDAIIGCKIYDKLIDPDFGDVILQPKSKGTPLDIIITPPDELTEPPQNWLVFSDTCAWHGLSIPTKIEWDSTDKVIGNASLKITTGNGWYVWASFRPAGGKDAKWDLSQVQNLSFWVKGIDTNLGHFQFNRIRLGNNCGGFYDYLACGDNQYDREYHSAQFLLNTSLNQWKLFVVPLKGNTVWKRFSTGNYFDIALSEINYIEFYADSYGVGYQLWLDGMTFGSPYSIEDNEKNSGFLENYPNPFNNSTLIKYEIPKTDHVTIKILDVFGKEVSTIINENKEAGSHEVEFNPLNLSKGLYFYKIQAGNYTETKKLLYIK